MKGHLSTSRLFRVMRQVLAIWVNLQKIHMKALWCLEAPELEQRDYGLRYINILKIFLRMGTSTEGWRNQKSCKEKKMSTAANVTHVLVLPRTKST